MSRGLSRDTCVRCGEAPVLEDPNGHQITELEAKTERNYEEFKGLIVSAAICPKCGARYLAWLSDQQCYGLRVTKYGGPFYAPDIHHQEPWPYSIKNLSFLSTFDDQPGPGDLPYHEADELPVQCRCGPYPLPSFGWRSVQEENPWGDIAPGVGQVFEHHSGRLYIITGHCLSEQQDGTWERAVRYRRADSSEDQEYIRTVNRFRGTVAKHDGVCYRFQAVRQEGCNE